MSPSGSIHAFERGRSVGCPTSCAATTSDTVNAPIILIITFGFLANDAKSAARRKASRGASAAFGG